MAEYVREENKYGVTKSESHNDQDTTPVDIGTKTESRGLTGFGGQSDPSKEQSTVVTKPQTGPVVDGETAAGLGTDYSMDSIEGGNPSGGTNYSATGLDGARGATGGTNYSGASAEGGNPTGGTDYSGADLPGSTTATS